MDSGGGERADDLSLWLPRLRELTVSEIRAVHADPRASAVTALLVGDHVGQPELAEKVRAMAAAGVCRAECVSDAQGLARAMLEVLTRLGGDFLPEKSNVAASLLRDARTLRTAMSSALDRAMPGNADVRLWLDAIHRGVGAVDVLYDLRTLVELFAEHARVLSSDTSQRYVDDARQKADAIEAALRERESPAEADDRALVARIWTLFVPAYDEVRHVGRFVSRGNDRSFPPLAMIAAHRRAKRRPASILPPPELRPAPPPLPKPPPLPPALSGAATDEVLDDELLEVDDVQRVSVPHAPPPIPALAPALASSLSGALAPEPEISPEPPPSSEPPSSGDEARGRKRHEVEIEVGIFSESNFFVGFSENLSEGGVFVATYCAKPIGAKIELTLQLPDGDALRVKGSVCWLRMDSCDGWPGMGIQFDRLKARDEERIRRFVETREPLFHPD